MKTKEIEFLNDLQDDYEELQEGGNNKGIVEVIKRLEMLEEIRKVYDISHFEQKYFPKPCSKIKQLEQFKAEYVKYEHSYYMERFMETCIKLFKEKK